MKKGSCNVCREFVKLLADTVFSGRPISTIDREMRQNFAHWQIMHKKR